MNLRSKVIAFLPNFEVANKSAGGIREKQAKPFIVVPYHRHGVHRDNHSLHPPIDPVAVAPLTALNPPKDGR
jgi:hypothetical protein